VRQLLDKCSGLQFLCFRGLQSTLCTNVVATISLLSVPRVRYLDLSNCNVTNRELSILSRCKSLEVLTLCGNHYITADGVLSVMMHCRTLCHLYLNQCPLVHASILFGNISIQPKGSVKYHMHMSTYASDSGVCILKKYYFPLDKKTGERRGVYIHNPPRGQYAYSTDPESMLPYV
jgi:Leucine-rich repeat (LRR) protein